ncbi:MAG: maleylpyruvate isomerase family mycothiol-dependent enzyme [Nitrospinota bacterium]|nr:maleylpyruvate isomerase family mycothiol-dependent enzyme [Nitrospinota bacterium]MDP7387096.1 maleylpyruvate isomerase family mycothiol-dependent enzyme [Nitrospinota bacterium]HJM42646.1 maleylpyruvate isomerase family mycothiol-dependent enzyme [Nitrospinota bacterium]
MDVEARAQFDPPRRLPKAHERLLTLLQGKADTGWAGPTNCGDWTFAQLTAHPIINAKFLAESVRVCLDESTSRPNPGDPKQGVGAEPGEMPAAAPPPPDPPLPFGVADLPAFNDWRGEETTRLVDGGPALLLSEFEESASNLQTQIRRIQHENASIPFWHPSGEGRLGYIPTFRLLELQLHGWDMRVMEDPGARLDEEVLPLLTDRLPLMLGRYARLRSRPDHPRIRVRIILTDPARNFLLDWRGPESRAAIDDGGPVAATLTGQSEIFVRLVGGRAGSFHVLGDAAAGNALAEVLFRPLKYL